MGGTAVRAVALCNPRLIDQINENFIPVFADQFESENGAWTHLVDPDAADDAPARLLLNALHARYLHKDGRIIKLFVVTVDGTLHEDGRNFMCDDPLQIVDEVIGPYMRAKHDQPPPAVQAYQSHPSSDVDADGLRLRVVVRYPTTPSKEALEQHNSQQVQALDVFVYMPAFVAPLRDWIVLTRDEVEKLLPAGDPIPGQTYAVDPTLVASIMRHFCPESGPVYVAENVPQSAEMTCSVFAVSPSTVRITLRARSLIANRGLTGMADDRRPLSRLEVSASGYIDYNPATRRVIDVQMASDAAFDVGPGGAQAFRAVAYWVAPDGADPKTR